MEYEYPISIFQNTKKTQVDIITIHKCADISQCDDTTEVRTPAQSEVDDRRALGATCRLMNEHNSAKILRPDGMGPAKREFFNLQLTSCYKSYTEDVGAVINNSLKYYLLQ